MTALVPNANTNETQAYVITHFLFNFVILLHRDTVFQLLVIPAITLSIEIVLDRI